MDHDRDLGAEGTADKAKGKLNQGMGDVEERVGKATGDEEMEESGLERQGKGNVQEGIGKVKDKVDDLLDH
jgi:uncharacterized protein YjbJ (UPF0337 family)